MSHSDYQTPPEYRSGLPPLNSVASGGFQDHFVLKRFQPLNGTEFKLGSRLQFKIFDEECLLHPNQVYLKWRPTAMKAGDKYSGAGARRAISGATAAIKNVAASSYGEVLEGIPNYNRYWAQEIMSAPLEQKVYLKKTEGISYFTDGKMNAENNQTKILDTENGKRYYMHTLQISALSSMGALEIPLIRGGINVELVLDTDLTNIYPIRDGIDGETWGDVELICVMTRPREGFWAARTKELTSGRVIRKPMQTVRHQVFQGNGGSQITINVDSNIVKSISSVLILGNKGKTVDAANGAVDKLSYSTDMGVRSIKFTVGGKNFPELKGISYHSLDPEAYVLGFRHQDLENVAFVPSKALYDSEALTEGTGTNNATGTATSLHARGWAFKFSFKDSLSAYGDGVTSLTGNFGITLSTVPDAPYYVTGTPDTFATTDSFDVYYVTDQILEITDSKVRVTPIF